MAAQQPARTSPELRARLHSARANVGITPRPGALPNDKGKVEGLVGYGRRNFMVPPLMHVNMHCRAVDAPLC